MIFKVIELDKEKSRTEMAFHDFVPPAVVKRIKSKKGKEVRIRRKYTTNNNYRNGDVIDLFPIIIINLAIRTCARTSSASQSSLGTLLALTVLLLIATPMRSTQMIQMIIMLAVMVTMMVVFKRGVGGPGGSQGVIGNLG